jgi:hypothetical protein
LIRVDSFVPPLSELPMLAYASQAIRAVVREELSADDADNLDITLAPLHLNEHNPLTGRVRLVFLIGNREFCRIPYRVLIYAEASFESRVN